MLGRKYFIRVTSEKKKTNKKANIKINFIDKTLCHLGIIKIVENFNMKIVYIKPEICEKLH